MTDFLSLNVDDVETRNDISDEGKGLEAFHHFTTPTLPHLLALLSHPTLDFPPSNTGLIIVDDLSTLFSLSYPNSNEKSVDQQTPGKANQVAQWAAGRRWAVLDRIISDLGKLAITRNIAILLTSQMITRVKDDARAVLCPAISGNAWESGITTRIIIFRDWPFIPPETQDQAALQSAVRFAGVTKVQNISCEGVGRVVAFEIAKHCLNEVHMDPGATKAQISTDALARPLKRSYGEVADSEPEDGEDVASDLEFGWDDEETTMEAERLTS